MTAYYHDDSRDGLARGSIVFDVQCRCHRPVAFLLSQAVSIYGFDALVCVAQMEEELQGSSLLECHQG